MKKNKKHKILSILLIVQILLVQFLSQKPEWIEEYYSTGVYPYISKFLRSLFGWLPFSFGDALGIFLIIYTVFGIYKLIKNRFKNLWNSLLRCTTYVSILYFCFYTFWGLNYFRQPLIKSFGAKQSKYTTEELIKTTEYIIEKLNETQLKITNNDSIKVSVPYSRKEIYTKAIDAYKIISKTYPQFEYQQPAIKSSLVSLLQTYNGTSGYLNPITGEAQVNNKIPKTGYPTTTCHEIAHQIGYAAENEANFIGFLASISHHDVYFQYAGYRMAFRYCISEIRKRDKTLSKTLWKTVHKGILKDYKASSNFWQAYRNPIEPIIKKGYNSYLKANNQAKGIESYNYVVDLIIHYF